MRYPCVFVAATVEPISKSPIDPESLCAPCIFREFGDQFRISQDSPRLGAALHSLIIKGCYFMCYLTRLMNACHDVSITADHECVNPLNIIMKLHDLIESPLMEIAQNPTVWNKWATTSAAQDVRVGFEAELIVPVSEPLEDVEPEPDYSENPAAIDIDEVVEFYSSTDFGMSRSEARQLRERMQSDFDAYVEDQLDDMFEAQGDRMVRQIARDYEGMDEQEIDDVMDAQSDKYQELADQARDQLRDQLLQQTDERDWLRHVGIRRMTDVESEYNVTWPIWETPASNQSATQVEEVAQHLRKSLGVKLYASTGYHTAPRMPDAWVLEPDSSIEVHDEDSQAGLELITPSPPPLLMDTLKYLDQVFTWAKSYGCETNRTTGFHMNMSLPAEIHVNLDPVKLILLLGDEKILANFGRSANTYAQSAFTEIEKHVKTTDNFPVHQALTALRSGMMKLAAQIMQKPFMGKYISVHVKPTYVEFRHAGGDYLDKLPEIKLTLLRMAYTLHVAADVTQAKPDYAKKLYALLSGFSRPQYTDRVINMFSLYNAGVIDAVVLKNELKQMRADTQLPT
jgi:hypothetical protein